MPESNPFAEIEALRAIAETASFGAAASRLGVSQSSISRRIQSLEERLGGERLVARTTRSVRLTQPGQRYLRSALTAVEQLRQAEQNHLDQEQNVEGTLRVSLPPAIGRAVLLPALTKVTHEHPALSIELDLSNDYVDFLDDRIDLAIRNRPTALTGIRDEQIGTSTLLLVCSKRYAAANPEAVAGDFADGHFILPRNEHRSDVDSLYARLKIDRADVRFFANDIAAIVALVEHDQGIAVLPDLLIQEGLRKGRLVKLKSPILLPVVQHFASYPIDLETSIRIKVVVEALGSAF